MHTTAFALSGQELAELAPAGKILAAVAVGPASSAVWSVRDPASGQPRGVTVSIAQEISKRTGVPVDLVEFSSSGAIVADADAGLWTLSFVPIDAERRKHVAVGSNYYLGVSTYLVREGEFTDVGDVDRVGVRVAGIEGTATFRSAERSLTQTTITAIKSLDEAVGLFQRREVDALALGKESIISLLSTIEGTIAAQGHFHEAGTAVVVPFKRPAALQAATRMIDALKADGTMRRIFDANKMHAAEVAP